MSESLSARVSIWPYTLALQYAKRHQPLNRIKSILETIRPQYC